MSEVTHEKPRPEYKGYPTLEYTRPAMEKHQLGMICFISSEAIFFLLLILSYLYFRSDVVPANYGPTAKTALQPLVTLGFSVALFLSSATMYMAERAIHAGKKAATNFWLIVTVTLGATFLTGQGIEYYDLISDKNLSLARNLFGTTFFTMTGFHGLHVFIGLIAIAVIGFMILIGAIKPTTSRALNTISIYWHFVDVVWVIIFSLVYVPVLFS